MAGLRQSVTCHVIDLPVNPSDCKQSTIGFGKQYLTPVLPPCQHRQRSFKYWGKSFFLPFLCLCVCPSAPTSVCFCLQALHSTRVRRDYAGRYLSAYQTAGHKSRPRRRVGLTVAEITGLSEYFDHGYVQQEARDGPLFMGFFFIFLTFVLHMSVQISFEIGSTRQRKEREGEREDEKRLLWIKILGRHE